jgi:hypothetical protein
MYDYAYINYSEAPALVGAAQAVWSGSNSRMRINIATGEKLKLAIAEDTGIDLFQVFITDSVNIVILSLTGFGKC